MARPKKYNVDYFPHLCRPSKTLYILEAQFGNDGYAFWFKLLEILATSDGHYLHLNDELKLEFLGAKTGLSGDNTTEILGLLARLDAIDKDLWEVSRLIWCQKLVDNVADVYKNRGGFLPEKPYFVGDMLRQNIDNHNINPVTIPHNTQTKLKETKLKETKNKVKYGEFKNILLTKDEHKKLVSKFGAEGATERIEKMSRAIESKGYEYESHYATILNWETKDDTSNKSIGTSKGIDPDKYVKGKFGGVVKR